MNNKYYKPFLDISKVSRVLGLWMYLFLKEQQAIPHLDEPVSNVSKQSRQQEVPGDQLKGRLELAEKSWTERVLE